MNVEVINVLEPAAHIRLRVYERGVGETRSCGTGACAAAYAALVAEGASEGTVQVDVPGGRLSVQVTAAMQMQAQTVTAITAAVDETALAADSMSHTIAAIREDTNAVTGEIESLGHAFEQIGDRFDTLRAAAESFSSSEG